MVKTFLSIAAVFFVCFSAMAAEPEKDGFYTRFDMAYSNPKGHAESGYVTRFGFGERWNDYFRTELSVSVHRYDLEGPRRIDTLQGQTKGRFSSTTAMVKAYWDIFNWHGVSPYISGGAGVSRNKTTDMTIFPAVLEGSANFRLAWEAGAGIGIELPKNLVLDIGYTYVDLGDFETKTTYNPWLSSPFLSSRRENARTHEVHVGLRYNF